MSEAVVCAARGPISPKAQGGVLLRLGQLLLAAVHLVSTKDSLKFSCI